MDRQKDTPGYLLDIQVMSFEYGFEVLDETTLERGAVAPLEPDLMVVQEADATDLRDGAAIR